MMRQETKEEHEESSEIEENRDTQKKVEKDDDVRSFELSGLMEPTVAEVNWRREGSGSIKEKITENDRVRKLENTRMKNSTESEAERRLKLSKLIDSDLHSVKDGDKDRASGTGVEI